MSGGGGDDHSTTSNKRIRIQFHHGGAVTRLSPLPLVARRQDMKDFLHAVWSEFGTVVDMYCHREFDYCVVQYQSRHQALFALAGLQDAIQVQVAVQSCVGADTDKAETAKSLFVGDKPITAEWAPPKTGNSFD